MRRKVCFLSLACLPAALSFHTVFSASRNAARTAAEIHAAAATSSLLQNAEGEECLSSYRKKAHEIAASFEPVMFRPAVTNHHAQTISALYLRTDKDFCYIPEDANWLSYALSRTGQLVSALQASDKDNGSFWDYRQRVNTPDGDFFHVDYKYHCTSRYVYTPTSNGLVIILHGLQASSNSSSSIDMAQAYCNQGFDVACINFRGCSGVPNDRIPAYHLGFTDDLKYYLELLHSNQGTESSVTSALPIFLTGFSLGANVVLKCLGELGENAHSEFNIHGAAVCCAPLDIERNAGFMQAPGFNKNVYSNFLLKSLKEATLAQLDRLGRTAEAQRINRRAVEAAETVTDFDNAVICPLFGFDDHIDYYRSTSSVNFLDDIRVPTFVLNAGDDPFFDPDFFPLEKSSDSSSGLSPLKMVRFGNGGHLGFLFHRESELENRLDRSVSFFPSELARFVKHVYDQA